MWKVVFEIEVLKTSKICLNDNVRTVSMAPHSILHYLLSANLSKVFSQLPVSIFIFSKYFFSIDFTRWKSVGLHHIAFIVILNVTSNNVTSKSVTSNVTYTWALATAQRQSPNLDLRPATLLKKRLWDRCFPVNLANFFRTSFLTEHLWWLLLCSTVYHSSCLCVQTFLKRERKSKAQFYVTLFPYLQRQGVLEERSLLHYFR